VAGNVGGLIFVVGTVLIVAVGLPSVLLFLVAATVAGCFVAWGLVAWHKSHPKRGLPGNLIELGGETRHRGLAERRHSNLSAKPPSKVLMDTLFQDLRYAARTFINNPGFAALTILCLALGIGVTRTIFSAGATVA